MPTKSVHNLAEISEKDAAYVNEIARLRGALRDIDTMALKALTTPVAVRNDRKDNNTISAPNALRTIRNIVREVSVNAKTKKTKR